MKKFFSFFGNMFKKNPRRKGRQITLAILLTLDGEKLLALRRAKPQILQFIDLAIDPSTLNDLSFIAIQKFSLELAAKLRINPVVFAALLSELSFHIEVENNSEDAKEFLSGIEEALSLV